MFGHRQRHPPHRDVDGSFSSSTSKAVVGLVAVLMAVDIMTPSKPLVLPMISAVLTVIGFTWAGIVAAKHRRGNLRPLQDKLMWPAFVLFFGFAAAMLSDADQLVGHLQLR